MVPLPVIEIGKDNDDDDDNDTNNTIFKGSQGGTVCFDPSQLTTNMKQQLQNAEI